MSIRNDLDDADQEFIDRFNQLLRSEDYVEAARVAATAPEVRRLISKG